MKFLWNSWFLKLDFLLKDYFLISSSFKMAAVCSWPALPALTLDRNLTRSQNVHNKSYKYHNLGYVYYSGNSYYQGNKYNPGYDL